MAPSPFDEKDFSAEGSPRGVAAVRDRIRPRREMWLEPRRRLRLLRRRWQRLRQPQPASQVAVAAAPCPATAHPHAPASAASLAGTQEPATRPAASASHSQSERSMCGQKQSPQSESAPGEASRRGRYRQEWCPRQDSQGRPRRFQPPRKLGCSQCFREGHGWFGKRSIGVGVGHEWFWAGHGFSRAVIEPIRMRAFSPEGRFSFYLAAEIE